jgi:hypothetical protein
MNKLVTPLFEREADAVPGPFYVAKDQCIICDLPPELAPKCFRMKHAPNPSDMYCHVYKQPETEAEFEAVYEAMAGSCVEAIRYCGTDPEILLRLKREGLSHLCDALKPEDESEQNGGGQVAKRSDST